MPIEVENVSHVYDAGTPFAARALHQLSCRLGTADLTGIIGPTGSGKSTLLQMLNGLLIPTSGQVRVDGVPTRGLKGPALRDLRQRVGLVFQFPEDQLFERTVFDDVAFGPRNQGLGEAEVQERVRWAMEAVQLDFTAFAARDPYSLSGGEKRRAAIAGALARRPRYLLLDEPTAGLDAAGRQQLLGVMRQLAVEYGTRVVLVSHRLEDIVTACDEVLVLCGGELFMQASPRQILQRGDELRVGGLELPWFSELAWELKRHFADFRTDLVGLEELADEIARVVGTGMPGPSVPAARGEEHGV